MTGSKAVYNYSNTTSILYEASILSREGILRR
ncbi:hypothetical protein Vi05172_g6079 [Venturia inaequalis]|nr:hypothetical protein Vi05172_g6079 [Venturia inaequalis]